MCLISVIVRGTHRCYSSSKIIEDRIYKMESCHIIVAQNQALLSVLIELTIQQTYPTARVSTVMDGQEVLRIYEQTGADLIITDELSPIVNGFDLARNLRAQGATLPIIVLAEEICAEKEAYEAGVTLFLRKPGLTNLLPLVLHRLLPAHF